ncbi:MAG: serine--tRNA ligase [Candidatus Altiarchaeota archaeon]|nr:serine--tRNA ligase [Candidatus Altiarchaeota archaeon]
MLDIRLFRETPKVVIDNLKKRGMDTLVVDKIKKLDEQWRKSQFELNKLRKERNDLSKQISGGDKTLVNKAKDLKVRMDKLENEVVPKLKASLDLHLVNQPNILQKDVPTGKDDSENVPIRYWGVAKISPKAKVPKGIKTEEFSFKPKDHQDLLIPKYLDIERAAKVSGARFYYQKGKLVELEMALLKFSLDQLKKDDFEIVSPPFMIRQKSINGVTHFSDFEDVIYKIADEDLYMIATAEHPIGSMHMNEILDLSELPLKYAGISPCFRKEAGSHGRDTKGMFRVHQFNKIEQFVFARPDESKKIHEAITKNIEDIFQKLLIPYRIVDICTGDIGYVASRKYDLEAWLPGQGKFREMGSSSNCTDWQSRRLNVKFKMSGEKPQLVHTLNNTALAVPRATIAVVENNQQEDGSIKIPKALWPYLDFREM